MDGLTDRLADGVNDLLGCARKNATFDFCDEHLESEGG